MTTVACLFAKSPVPGRVKTRLAAVVGPERACRIHRALGRRVRDVLREVPRVTVQIWMEPDGDPAAVENWLGGGDEIRVQRGADLGERMAHAADTAFAEGAERVIIVGCDAPELSTTHVCEALDALADVDLSFIPVHDGGYVLVGLARPVTDFFQGIVYGRDDVFAVTQARAAERRFRTAVLGVQHDLDDADDLALFPEVESWPD